MSDASLPRRPSPADQAERDAAASHIDSHVILEAGAGSGKTTSLIARYMHIVDHDPGAQRDGAAFLDRIAAITFTNKAAREMKQRLRAEFVRRMKSAADVHGRRNWRERLRRLETAPIQTIHALCTSLLKQFPFAAGVDPEFQVIDELQTTTLLPQAVRDSLLAGLEEDRLSAGLVIGYYESVGSAAGALEALICKREKYRRYLDNPPTPGQLLEYWEQEEKQWLEEAVKGLLADPAWTACLADLRAFADTALDYPEDKLSPRVVEMLHLAQDLPGPDAEVLTEWLSTLQQSAKVGNAGAKSAWEAHGSPTAVRQRLKDLVAVAESHLGLVTTAVPPLPETAEIAAAIWEEARCALEAWRELKDTQNVLDYDDLQIKVRDLLRGDRQVRAQLQRRFRHILVDEFQDTNELQSEIVWLLAGVEKLGNEAARVFVVGDAKQSIYRFRDADVVVYNTTRTAFEGKAHHEARRLGVSFRPNSALMEFFNRVFSCPQVMGTDEKPPYEARYEPMQATRDAVPVVPAVMGVLVAHDDSEAFYRRIAEARALARIVRSLLDQRPLVFDHDTKAFRTLRAGDIAILFRAMTQSYLYEEQLAALAIPYYNASGRGFFGRPEVTDVLNVLRAVANPDDAIALVGALRSPLFSTSDETLFWLAQDRERTWWERVQAASADGAARREPYSRLAEEDLSRLRRAGELLGSWRDRHDRLPLSGLIGEILESTGYGAAMAAQVDGLRAVANLGKLTDLARSQEQSGCGGLAGFVAFLTALADSDTQEAQAPTEEEAGESVRLSSIHAAKGLQWPVVIVADLGRKRGGGEEMPLVRSHPKSGLVPVEGGDIYARRWRLMGEILAAREKAEGLAEDRRLLYVAMTRASDLLILSSSVQPTQKGLSGYDGNLWLAWLLEASGVDTTATLPGPNIVRVDDGSLCPWYLLPSESEETPEFGVALREEVPEPVPAAEPAPPTMSATDAEAGPGDTPQPGFALALTEFGPDTGARRRFAVTELADYLMCPLYYRLRHLQSLPDVEAHKPVLSRGLSSVERGILAHRLLQMVGTGGLDALEGLLGETVPGGGTLRSLSPGDLQELRSLLEWYLAGDFYRQHVAAAQRLRTEAWVSFLEGDVVIEGKVDAVAEGDKGLVLIDYKTGRGRTGVADEAEPGGNRFQLALYAHGLRRVMGRLPSVGALIYLSDRAIDEAPLETEADEARRQAVSAVEQIRRGEFLPHPESVKCGRCRLRWACREGQ